MPRPDQLPDIDISGIREHRSKHRATATVTTLTLHSYQQTHQATDLRSQVTEPFIVSEE